MDGSLSAFGRFWLPLAPFGLPFALLLVSICSLWDPFWVLLFCVWLPLAPFWHSFVSISLLSAPTCRTHPQIVGTLIYRNQSPRPRAEHCRRHLDNIAFAICLAKKKNDFLVPDSAKHLQTKRRNLHRSNPFLCTAPSPTLAQSGTLS